MEAAKNIVFFVFLICCLIGVLNVFLGVAAAVAVEAFTPVVACAVEAIHLLRERTQMGKQKEPKEEEREKPKWEDRGEDSGDIGTDTSGGE